jgi:hypothetical protein
MKRTAGPNRAAVSPRSRGETEATRILLYVPIIHTRIDMGTLAGSVRRLTAQKLSRQVLKRNEEVIGRMWTLITEEIEQWELPWAKVRLYQDGLPRCGSEADIVRELAQVGSPNHRILSRLMERGATLMGTESPELLLKEYGLVKEVLAAADPQEAAQLEARARGRSRKLLHDRDRYIASRINDSLRPGEIGILFLGLLHSPERWLDRDIEVRFPIEPLDRMRRRVQ